MTPGSRSRPRSRGTGTPLPSRRAITSYWRSRSYSGNTRKSCGSSRATRCSRRAVVPSWYSASKSSVSFETPAFGARSAERRRSRAPGILRDSQEVSPSRTRSRSRWRPSTACASAERGAQRHRGFGHGLLALVEQGTHAEEAVDHAVVARERDRNACLAQPCGVRLSLVTERIELRRDHQRRRQAAQI